MTQADKLKEWAEKHEWFFLKETHHNWGGKEHVELWFLLPSGKRFDIDIIESEVR